MDVLRFLLPLLCLHLLLAGETTPRLDPVMQRLDLKPQDAVEVVFTLHAPPGTTATTVLADCACLKVLTPTPVAVGPDGTLEIRLRATGMRPGIEDVAVATTAGMARAQLQLVGPGAGRGIEQLREALAEAAKRKWSVLGIAHDLRGQIRHCNCTSGSLGGAGRLARLPGVAQETAPGVAATWVLSGDADGPRPGVGAALAGSGWRIGDPSVRVVDDPLPLLTAPGVVAVIPTRPAAVEHRRILRPLLTGGLAVELLLVDAAGAVQGRRTMPVDDSLPDDPALAARFPDTLSRRIVGPSALAQGCADCHPTAHAAWLLSKHARAWEGLPEADRTDACVGCHSTPVAADAISPGVDCTACHRGTEAHAQGPGTTRTAGTVDCRSCHDAQHHPAFQREPGWKAILHAREPAP